MMLRKPGWTVLLGLFFSIPVSAEPSQTERDAAKSAEVRGQDLYAYDQAAWHATDRLERDLRANGSSLSRASNLGLRGYVVEPSGGLLMTTFYAERGGVQSAFARYWVLGSNVQRGGIVQPDADSVLSVLALRMIAARQAALVALQAGDYELCSQAPPNTVVLPPDAADQVSVYVLSSQTENGVYPAGGHYRFDFNGHGKLINERRFMNSCFPIDWREKSGNKPEFLFVTHLLDPQPTEIHAFVSRYVPLPILVGAISSKELWSVSRGAINFERDLPEN